MRLSYQIPLITGFVLVLTIFVNLFAFQSIADKRVYLYQQEVEQLISAPDPDKLKSFAELSSLDEETREEYIILLQELSTISTALQNISTNPELYISNTADPTSTSLTLGSTDISRSKKPILTLFNIRTLGQNTAEGRLVTGIIKELTIVNLVWLLSIYVLYMLWIRYVFFPIEKITENIQRISENKSYTSLKYTKNDEFFPLISAINNLHKSLSIQEKIRINFLADLSHEIRTPMTAVGCYLEAIEDGVMQLDQDTIKLFKNELARLTSTTENLMEFDKIMNPLESNIQVTRLSFRKHIMPMIQEYLPQTQKNNQSIVIDMPKDTMMRIDASMCSQIIHNVFSNFVKYAGPKTTLTCRLEKNEEEVVLIFEDNGVGISEKDIPLVKEKFYRVDRGRTRKDKSMGIGLSIIEHIMRNHGGHFNIRNTTPHGLTIALYFPR